MTHICVSKLTIIGSDNDLSPGWRQAIIWTNAGLLLIGPLGTNFSEILIEVLTFSFKKMRFKLSSATQNLTNGKSTLVQVSLSSAYDHKEVSTMSFLSEQNGGIQIGEE